MLYSQDEIKQNPFLLKLMVEKAISGYSTGTNLLYKQKIIDILKEVDKLHQSEDEIYNINSVYFQEIIFLYKHATYEMYKDIEKDIKIEQLNALYSLLEAIK